MTTKAGDKTERLTGALHWRKLLQWLREDGLVSAAAVADTTQRFGASDSRQHPLVRLASAGLVDAKHGIDLDAEALTEWLANRAGLPYLRIDPLKVDVGRVAEVMSITYAERRRALPVQVGAREVTIATCEPFDTGWVAEIEAHTKKAVKLVVASPVDLQRFTTEFYTLSRSVRAAIKSGESSAAASFEQLVELAAAAGVREAGARQAHERVLAAVARAEALRRARRVVGADQPVLAQPLQQRAPGQRAAGWLGDSVGFGAHRRGIAVVASWAAATRERRGSCRDVIGMRG